MDVEKLTVKQLAEQFRVRLGLRTWEDQVEWAEAKRQGLKNELSAEAFEAMRGRQSGRTTKGLLHVIAYARKHSGGRLVVEGNSDLRERVLVEVAKNLVAKLGLELEVRGYRTSKTAHYRDHED
jgi:hypothetical protein